MHSFKAKIYKVGINPCVKVPLSITADMIPKRGYIPIKGKINEYAFTQTLVPVKHAPYRLFVNGIMLKGANTAVGKTAKFSIEQDFSTRPKRDATMQPAFKHKLEKAGKLKAFKKLTPYRQKEILRYLYYLKTNEARARNIEKIIGQLTSEV